MQAEFKKLLRLLEKECGYQDKLLDLLSRERQAIVELNREKISKINDEKIAIIDKARGIEEERREVLGQLIPEPVSDDRLKLASIIAKCPNAEIRSELSRVGQELKNMAKNVCQINDHNSELIKQSMGIISSVIAILRSSPETDLPTYTDKGSLSSRTEDPAFAKRSGSIVYEV